MALDVSARPNKYVVKQACLPSAPPNFIGAETFVNMKHIKSGNKAISFLLESRSHKAIEHVRKIIHYQESIVNKVIKPIYSGMPAYELERTLAHPCFDYRVYGAVMRGRFSKNMARDLDLLLKSNRKLIESYLNKAQPDQQKLSTIMHGHMKRLVTNHIQYLRISVNGSQKEALNAYQTFHYALKQNKLLMADIKPYVTEAEHKEMSLLFKNLKKSL